MVDKVRTVYELLIELERALVGDTRTSRVPTVVMGPVNKDANGASEGWVGVYADTVAYSPRTVGAGMGNWGSSTVLRVIVQPGARGEEQRRQHEQHQSGLVDRGNAHTRPMRYRPNSSARIPSAMAMNARPTPRSSQRRVRGRPIAAAMRLPTAI